jgi:Lipocalin-like domain
VQNSICYFGKYTVDEAAKTLTFHIEGCSFPNWTGTDQKRSFTLGEDELAVDGVSSFARPFSNLWKRPK